MQNMANPSNTQKFTIFDIQQIHARVMSGIFFLFVWWFFGSRYGDFIYLVQDNDLFLYRWDFFTQTFSTPGDFLYYLTSFMIQFFYYPLLGGLILAVFLTLIQRLTARIFQLHGSFYFCSFLPSLLLCITPTWWCYYAFIPFCIPNMFSSILGLLITFSVLFIYSSFKTPTARLTFIVIFSIFGYLPFGFWGLFPMLLCLFRERMITRRLWSERETSSQKDTSSTKKNAITSSVPASEQKALRVRCELMFSMILLIPLLWYYTVSFRFIKYHNIYIQGLIEEIRYLKDTLTCTITYSLLVVTCLFYVVGFGIVSWRTGRKTPTNRSKVTSKSKSEPLKNRKAEKLSFKNRRPFINWLLFVFLLVTTVLTSCRGENFFAILKITRPLA
ncbi:MAG: hypothetical protein IKW74_04190, partial [Thermoguttaceae bacterium]|nr:hypothetical protein [Thermoguttaceae bacterium]